MIAPLLTEASEPYLTTMLEADWACTWLSLEGQLVQTTIPAFQHGLTEALKLGRRKIVLLMVDVSNTDAAGVAALDRAKAVARDRGIRLAVRSARRARTRRPIWIGLGDRA